VFEIHPLSPLDRVIKKNELKKFRIDNFISSPTKWTWLIN
jgi:hypothetical protein